ncbi:MAG TPA: elongation factor P [Anaerolineales bacterium]|nr:elongation factor P [Anaerolineales bacterium]
MVDVNELRKGVTFEIDNHLYRVLDYTHSKPGRGKATIRVKTRNLRTGANIEMTFTSSDRVQDVELEHHTVQFLYTDGEHYHFMDLDTFEQPAIPAEVVSDIAPYLKEGVEIKLTFYGSEPLDLDIPITVEQRIDHVDMAVRGDTATGVNTRAVTETGLEVQVPAFVNAGDTIRIDTRTGTYVARV